MQIDEPTVSTASAEGLRFAVLTATFNSSVTDGLRNGAVEFLEDAGAAEVRLVDAPGAFELPLLAYALARQGYDAIVCLGAVIEGDTDHYEHVAHRASEGLMRVQLETGIPVSFGILTTRNSEDAIARSQPGPNNKGREAAAAAVSTARTLRALGSP
jgi:6,7-dimethyl-8-ribityllumazine synthase